MFYKKAEVETPAIKPNTHIPIVKKEYGNILIIGYLNTNSKFKIVNESTKTYFIESMYDENNTIRYHKLSDFNYVILGNLSEIDDIDINRINSSIKTVKEFIKILKNENWEYENSTTLILYKVYKCKSCNSKIATWNNIEGELQHLCDVCVPRNCSCNHHKDDISVNKNCNEVKSPCCKYSFSDKGYVML